VSKCHYGLAALTSDEEKCSFETRSVQKAATSAARDLGYPNLKPEQFEVVEAFMKGHDAFAVLPLVYSAMESLCYTGATLFMLC